MIKKLIATSAAALAVGAGSVAATAGTASAAGGDGKVISKTNLVVRHAPSIHAKSVGSIKPGKVIPLSCKATGTTVDGNNRWYLLPGSDTPEWVSARYIKNIGTAPGWCGNKERFVGRTTAALTRRVAPNTADAKAGTYAKGAGVDIICKASAQNIDGNKIWYWTTGHQWVSARYVSNVGRAPNWCVEF
jgi:hypothetical protein